jgi:fructose-1-phosphate kinase PfkB-like protein
MRQDDDTVSNYTERARHAVLHAAQTERDFAGWLAAVLAEVAAHLGSSNALTAGRPGSWEADLVQRLVKGTVGWGDEFLGGYAQGAASSPRDRDSSLSTASCDGE